MKLEQDYELDIFGKPCMIAIPHRTSDYIDFAVKEQEDQISASHYLSEGDDETGSLNFILIDDVHIDFMHNTARMVASIEQDMVQKVYIDEEVCYIVKSFTTEVVSDISTEQGMMTACNCIEFQQNKRVSKIDCHDNNKRNATAYIYYLGINSSLRVHMMDETALIQNTVENNHIEAVTDSSDVLQSEVPSDAGDRTDEVLTSITNTVTNV
ncbi:hypothetical protein G6F71_003753 [Rhizopus microsporus]|nr:hypothetical protein G6F71_003753 [Rhizopus microsporus]KAG1234552.1 hypothetical protein G6F67_003457 [Rhizopus microsporus]KAG1266884.1 hypothetical protein G6F68_002400 [Rhizopus microsporus]